MASRLKLSDLPEPWFPPKKGDVTSSRQKSITEKCNAVEDSNTETIVKEPKKRGRGRPKANSKVVNSTKGKGRQKTLPPSAVDLVLGLSKTVVPDVDDLRRQREHDAAACGRNLKTILQPDEARSGAVPITLTGTAGQCMKTAGACSAATPEPPPKSSRNATWTENENEMEQSAQDVSKKPNLGTEAPSVQRPGKEPMTYDVEEPVHTSRSVQSSRHQERALIDLDSDRDSKGRRPRLDMRKSRRSLSPHEDFYVDRYGQRLPRRSESSRGGCISRSEDYRHSSRRSPQMKWCRSGVVHERRSPCRSDFRSPENWRGGRHHKTIEDVKDYIEENAYGQHFDEDYHRASSVYDTEQSRRERYESLSPDEELWRRKCRSPQRGGSVRRRSWTPESSRSRSPQRMSKTAADGRAMERRSVAAVKEERFMGMSPTVGRRDRRQRLNSREAEVESREKCGKKPFYLMVDREGRPYGPGQPAWIADINKLAKYLDPSCTNIRKQTFEDVQTFKDRLNEHFDYAGTLNEDHLRGLMGKAVTRKRGELISLIKRNGKQPFDIDRAVWRRLEKLAYSKQRQQKSEQGRYANSCRRTLGRTGAGGENGVRERLRLLYGRSPHPHEVEDEMQRDKGFGGRKRKVQAVWAKEEKNRGEVLSSDGGRRSESLGRYSDGLSSDSSQGAQYRRYERDLPEGSGRASEYFQEEVDVGMGRIPAGQRRYLDREAEEISKDDYIRKLQDEVERLRAEQTEASTSKYTMP